MVWIGAGHVAAALTHLRIVGVRETENGHDNLAQVLGPLFA
jgi:hypothetical protein